jgi:GntR family transcriptional repressor for pyruvate dehydrogenase complex
MTLDNNPSLFVPPQRVRLHEGIAEQLKNKIISRQIPAGAKLPPERELADTMNVNRSTVRAALNKLESMELVEIRHGDGVYVRDYLESGSLELAKQLLIRDGTPDVGILRNLSELRRILLPEMASLAARNRSEKDLRALEKIVFESGEMPMAEKDWRFHNIIARAGGNAFFVILLNAFTGLLKDYAYLYFDVEKNARNTEVYHRDMCDAIKKKDSEQARKKALAMYIRAEQELFKTIAKIQAE